MHCPSRLWIIKFHTVSCYSNWHIRNHLNYLWCKNTFCYEKQQQQQQQTANVKNRVDRGGNTQRCRQNVEVGGGRGLSSIEKCENENWNAARVYLSRLIVFNGMYMEFIWATIISVYHFREALNLNYFVKTRYTFFYWHKNAPMPIGMLIPFFI